jgi:hypothetical protein
VWVVVLQVSVVHGLRSSHWASAVQQPEMGVSPQVPAVQVVVLQVAVGQAAQAAPVPQAAGLPCWQVPLLSQQPVGQLVAVHTQVPFEQVWPEEQQVVLAPVPHVVPAVQRQAPFWQLVPLGQEPQESVPPQPSDGVPQVAPSDEQVAGVQQALL